MRTFSAHLLKKLNNESISEKDTDYPDINDGIQGVRFVDVCVESSKNGSAWIIV